MFASLSADHSEIETSKGDLSYAQELGTAIDSALRMRCGGPDGPCTEAAIKQGGLPVADNAYFYMPPYGKPVTGETGIQTANTKNFSDRTNIKRTWQDDRRIVSSPTGEMAYEAGTMHMSYDSKSEGHNEFNAVILTVYQAKGGQCQTVALTMQPLEEKH